MEGFVGLLQKHLTAQEADATSLHYLNMLTHLAQQAERLVNGLLNLSRTGRAEMHPGRIDMNRLVQEVKQHLEVELQERALIWQIEPLPIAWGDRTLIRLVLQNLMENAVKYTRPRSQPHITIGSLDQPRETIFFIRDNGIGFDPKYSDRLFGTFQRLHNDPQFEGSGLGLANVQRIIYRHGGRVWAEAEPDQGACFYFSLPRASSAPLAEESR